MSESSDYTDSSWVPDHDFSRSRKVYTEEASRSYQRAEEKETKDWDLLPESIATQAKYAMVIALDDTGSMHTWPTTIRTKAVYFDYEIRNMYLGDDTDVAYCSFGDAHENERFPLQVRPFARGKNEHEVRLGELVHVAGGGSGLHESAELAALYVARNVHVPNQVHKPLFILITDEKPYAEVTVSMARKAARVELPKSIKTEEIFAELKRKFSVYVIMKPYQSASYQSQITSEWEKLVGKDCIAFLPDENRVVDVTFGILGHYTGKIDAFKRELESRQTPEQVRVVLAALKPIFDNAVSDGRSITHGLDDEGDDVGSL